MSRLWLLIPHTGDYKEVLQKYISPDQLPEAYGGTRCEPDPYCSKYVSQSNSTVWEDWGTVLLSFWLSDVDKPRRWCPWGILPVQTDGGQKERNGESSDWTSLVSSCLQPRGDTWNQTHVNVVAPDCHLTVMWFHIPSRWEFMSTDYDISYGLYHNTEDGKKDVVCK